MTALRSSTGDLLLYAHPNGDRPALYAGAHGLRHILEIRFKGKPQLVYALSSQIRPAADSGASP